MAACRRALAAERGLLAESLIALILLELFALAPALAFAIVIDKVLANRALATLATVVLGLGLLAGFEYFFQRVRGALSAELRARLARAVDPPLVARLLALPAEAGGEALGRLRRLEALRGFALDAAETLAVVPALLLGFGIAMLAFSPRLALLVAGAAALHALFLVALRGVQRRSARESARRQEATQALLAEAAAGLDSVRALGAAPAIARRWAEAAASQERAAAEAQRWQGIGRHAGALRSRLVFAAMLALGAFELIDGALSVGGLVAFAMLLRQVASLVERLAPLGPRWIEAKIWAERLDAALAGAADAETPAPVAGPAALALEAAAWRAQGGVEIIANLTLAIAPGEIVVISGPSGAGKSTLLALLGGLRRPTRGRATLDGFDLARAGAAGVALVPQEPWLHAGTIAENLRLACAEATAAELTDAASLAQVHDAVLRLPGQYDTRLGESGRGLSAGERQRLCIARALLANPRALLLDEPTAALDPATEAEFAAAVPRLAAGRTLVIATHRPQAFAAVATRLLVLDRGRLAPARRFAHVGG